MLSVGIYIFFLFLSFNIFNISVNQKKINYVNNSKSEIINRGKILDRNKNIISATIPTFDLYLDTKKIINIDNARKEIIKIYPEKEKFLENIFKKKKYILIDKHLSNEQRIKINEIGEPGFIFHSSEKRVYPQKNLFAHTTGFLSKFGKSQSKLEKSYDKYLKSGKDLNLTLDLRIQNVVYEEIKKGKEIFNASSAVGLVLNVNNGEIISMVSLPDYDPNYPSKIKPFTENNLITNARYEMGSTLKMFNAAMAFEHNLVDVEKLYEIPNKYQLTKNYIVKDESNFINPITFEEIYTNSSNVGNIIVLEQIGINKQKTFFKKLGFEDKLDLKGINVINNNFPQKENWNDILSKSISIGYGISISPLSLARSFASLVNGGKKINVKIIKSDKNKTIRVISEDTSSKINNILKKIIETGTGKRAMVSKIEVGGKTGTAKKSKNKMGYHDNKYITSFIGTFPIEKPKFLVFVLFDEPKDLSNKNRKFTGGTTAAPVFSKIVERIFPILKQINF
tara:strand:+ start:3505 stop:5031 length:1527 start_codon:yes stop_codon:yes gene_type:complete